MQTVPIPARLPRGICPAKNAGPFQGHERLAAVLMYSRSDASFVFHTYRGNKKLAFGTPVCPCLCIGFSRSNRNPRSGTLPGSGGFAAEAEDRLKPIHQR